jgi:hypothetical protein
MKLSTLRGATARTLTLALAATISLTLAACGGGGVGSKAQYTIAGTLSGLTNPGLVLASNGQTDSPAAGDVTFAFAKTIDYGEEFNVLVQTNPDHQTCTVGADGNSSAGHTVAIDATVTCVQNSYYVGGTISGLTVAGLILGNGTATTLTPVVDATTFTMPSLVNDGASYGITVLANPVGLTCTVANGTGIMGGTLITGIANNGTATTNVVVTCVPNT